MEPFPFNWKILLREGKNHFSENTCTSDVNGWNNDSDSVPHDLSAFWVPVYLIVISLHFLYQLHPGVIRDSSDSNLHFYIVTYNCDFISRIYLPERED